MVSFQKPPSRMRKQQIFVPHVEPHKLIRSMAGERVQTGKRLGTNEFIETGSLG